MLFLEEDFATLIAPQLNHGSLGPFYFVYIYIYTYVCIYIHTVAARKFKYDRPPTPKRNTCIDHPTSICQLSEAYCLFSCVNTHECVYIYIYKHTIDTRIFCINIYVFCYVYIHTYLYICIYIYTRYIYICIYIHTY